MSEEPLPKREIFFKKRRLGEDETLENNRAWAALGDEEKFTQAWEMVKMAHLIKGGTLDERISKICCVSWPKKKLNALSSARQHECG